MKIYTKTGDKGETSLIGGTRVPKHHIRIEAYGTIDELNSHIGLVRDQLKDKKTINLLVQIQNALFTIGSHLASDPQKSKMKLPEIKEEEITVLEKEIDLLNELLPPLKNFILPGGHVAVSVCHVARCVCRRAERCVTHLSETETIHHLITQYLNRLSDYLFMLARKISFDNNVQEFPWRPFDR
jgi:cob(I)alamin adenosyltransferase